MRLLQLIQLTLLKPTLVSYLVDIEDLIWPEYEKLLWREHEKLFRKHYAEERAAEEWIDLGGES